MLIYATTVKNPLISVTSVCVCVCLMCCLTSQSISKVLKEHCFYFIRLMMDVITAQISKCYIYVFLDDYTEPLFMDRLESSKR